MKVPSVLRKQTWRNRCMRPSTHDDQALPNTSFPTGSRAGAPLAAAPETAGDVAMRTSRSILARTPPLETCRPRACGFAPVLCRISAVGGGNHPLPRARCARENEVCRVCRVCGPAPITEQPNNAAVNLPSIGGAKLARLLPSPRAAITRARGLAMGLDNPPRTDAWRI
jgi:hypothetical protein